MNVTGPREPTLEERQLIANMTVDPFDYVPPPASHPTPRRNTASQWAPVLGADGQPALGMMMTGFPGESWSPDYAIELLALARLVTNLSTP